MRRPGVRRHLPRFPQLRRMPHHRKSHQLARQSQTACRFRNAFQPATGRRKSSRLHRWARPSPWRRRRRDQPLTHRHRVRPSRLFLSRHRRPSARRPSMCRRPRTNTFRASGKSRISRILPERPRPIARRARHWRAAAGPKPPAIISPGLPETDFRRSVARPVNNGNCGDSVPAPSCALRLHAAQ